MNFKVSRDTLRGRWFRASDRQRLVKVARSGEKLSPGLLRSRLREDDGDQRPKQYSSKRSRPEESIPAHQTATDRRRRKTASFRSSLSGRSRAATTRKPGARRTPFRRASPMTGADRKPLKTPAPPAPCSRQFSRGFDGAAQPGPSPSNCASQQQIWPSATSRRQGPVVQQKCRRKGLFASAVPLVEANVSSPKAWLKRDSTVPQVKRVFHHWGKENKDSSGEKLRVTRRFEPVSIYNRCRAQRHASLFTSGSLHSTDGHSTTLAEVRHSRRLHHGSSADAHSLLAYNGRRQESTAKRDNDSPQARSTVRSDVIKASNEGRGRGGNAPVIENRG